jgi:hypothetical protein
MQKRSEFGYLIVVLVAASSAPAGCGGSAKELTQTGQDAGADAPSAGGSGAGPAGASGGGSGGSSGGGNSGAGNAGAGNAGAGNAGSGATGGSSAGTGSIVCTPMQQLPGGVEQCAEGFKHRATAGSCPLPTNRVPCDPSVPDKSGCTSDANCSSHPNGYCERAGDRCLCRYPCARDADCDPGQICQCSERSGSVVGQCVPSACVTDADCGGTFCASSTGNCGGEYFGCFASTDECRVDAECGTGKICSFFDGVRKCGPAGCGATSGS